MHTPIRTPTQVIVLTFWRPIFLCSTRIDSVYQLGPCPLSKWYPWFCDGKSDRSATQKKLFKIRSVSPLYYYCKSACNGAVNESSDRSQNKRRTFTQLPASPTRPGVARKTRTTLPKSPTPGRHVTGARVLVHKSPCKKKKKTVLDNRRLLHAYVVFSLA